MNSERCFSRHFKTRKSWERGGSFVRPFSNRYCTSRDNMGKFATFHLVFHIHIHYSYFLVKKGFGSSRVKFGNVKGGGG
jgi:hypothetical protein